ncbi:MAG: DUF4349 domain-containing protein [Eubacteriaceae bacterium]
MNCSDINSKMQQFIDGLLSEKDAQDFMSHINVCKACKSEYENTVKIIGDIKKYGQSLPDANINISELLYKSNLSLEDSNMKKKKNYLNKNFIKKFSSYAAVFLLGVFIYASFAGGLFNGLGQLIGSNYGESSSPSYQSDGQKSGSVKDESLTNNTASDSSKNNISSNFELSPDKIIYNSSMVLQVQNYDTAREGILNIVKQNNSFIQNEDKNISKVGSNEYYTSTFTIRVPAKNFADMNAALQKLGKVEYYTTYASNVTYEYNDLVSSTEQLKEQRANLLKLYKKANTVSELIEIENELTRVNTLISQNESTLKNYDRSIEYSTIQMSISEDVSKNSLVNPFSQIGQKIKSALINSSNALLKLLAFICLLIFKIIPFAAAAFIVYLIVRFVIKSRKKNINKNKNTDNNDEN